MFTVIFKQLRRLGCALGQGYLFARPADGPAIAAAFLAPAVSAPTPGHAPRAQAGRSGAGRAIDLTAGLQVRRTQTTSPSP